MVAARTGAGRPLSVSPALRSGPKCKVQTRLGVGLAGPCTLAGALWGVSAQGMGSPVSPGHLPRPRLCAGGVRTELAQGGFSSAVRALSMSANSPRPPLRVTHRSVVWVFFNVAK